MIVCGHMPVDPRGVNLVVPMAGTGARFQKAGYGTYKPFLMIAGKPMIQHVLDLFPPSVPKYLIVDRARLTPSQRRYLRRQPGVRLCPIQGHSLGPAYSLWKAANQLPATGSLFISYCDIVWNWDFQKVLKELSGDGAVFTRRSFHPHLIQNNFSAFCLPRPDDPGRLGSIREKASFTDRWMEEPLSIGLFYIKNSVDLRQGLRRLIQNDSRVAGEFYPSMLFNEMLDRGRTVSLRDVDFFLHWGTPEHLRDFEYWARVIPDCARMSPLRRGIRNICCMGGMGRRMQAMSGKPKALLDVDGHPMYQYVARRFGCADTSFLTTDATARTLVGECRSGSVVPIGKPTRSQLETMGRAQGVLCGSRNFFLTSCDAFGGMEMVRFQTFVRDHRPDAVVFTFQPTLTQGKLSQAHTYVSAKKRWVKAVHIKSRTTDQDAGMAGFFWFAKGRSFAELDQAGRGASGEKIVDHFLKHLVESGRRVAAYPLNYYVHLGTPEEYQEFQFWLRYANLPLLQEAASLCPR